MRNLGLAVSRQFHLQERLKRQVLEYQAYLMKKVQISLEKKLAAPAMSLSSELCLFIFTTVDTRILVFKGVDGRYIASINNDLVDRFPATKGPAPNILPVDRRPGYLVMMKDHRYHI